MRSELGTSGGVSDVLSEPLYSRTEDGALDGDPLRLAAPAKRFSLERLALLLDGLPFEAEFPPECPWEGVVRHRPPLDLPPLGTSDESALREEFAAAVSRSLGDAESAVVLLSGGMDSWAVFVQAWEQTRREGRRLGAVVWNLRDQFGKATASLVHRQLRAVGISCDLHVLPAEWRALPEPRWSPLGPRHDYYTRLHQATVDHAHDIGATVVLSGQGGDEVLGAWNHLSASLARGRRWRDLRHYLAAFGRGDSVVEVAGEAAALAARRLPPQTSFQLYVATALRDVVNSGRPSVLTDVYRDSVAGWVEDWLAARFASFQEAGCDWATASLRDSIFPWAYDAHPLGAPSGSARRSWTTGSSGTPSGCRRPPGSAPRGRTRTRGTRRCTCGCCRPRCGRCCRSTSRAIPTPSAATCWTCCPRGRSWSRSWG